MADSLNPAIKMTDEELDAALEELGVPSPKGPNEEQEVVKKPEDSKTPPADPAEEADPPEEDPAEEELPEDKPKEDEEDPKPSRREQLRIQDLLRKYPSQQEPAPAPAAKPATGLLDIDADVDADDALKERLKADRDAAVKAALEGAAAQNNDFAQQKASLLFHTRLEVDAPRIEGKYPVLDKDSDKFKPALANAVNTMYLNTVGYDQASDTVKNPTIRYTDFVEALFELGDEIGTSKAEATKKAVVQQAAKTGLRPDGAAAKPALNLNKPPQQMTDEELDAAIAQMIG